MLNFIWDGEKGMLYNNLSGYLRKTYNKRLKKICIDGGFYCPNRDGTVSFGGCIFCGERGAGEHIQNCKKSIIEQVDAELKKGKEDDLFIAYFQNYTNTYADTETLKKRYDEALCDKRIVILSVGTRPDCINEETADLLASYKDRVDVWVELGLQSSKNDTGRLINRGYDTDVFDRAVKILKDRDIKVIAHMIVGLPGESMADAQNTAKYIAKADIFGIKIHSIYVMEGTKLAEMYRENLYTPPTLSEFAETVATIIGYLPEDLVIHRLTGDCPRDMLVAPEWNTDKHKILDEINKCLTEKNISQGSLIEKSKP